MFKEVTEKEFEKFIISHTNYLLSETSRIRESFMWHFYDSSFEVARIVLGQHKIYLLRDLNG